jgi:hypothetical protein
MGNDDSTEFDDEFLDYARRALEMAGIETSPELKKIKPIAHSLLHSVSENFAHYRAARASCPQSMAHWEQAEFMKAALRAAVWDMQWGAITTYSQFVFLYSRLLSDKSLPFLPQLFAAAALSPSVDAELSNRLMKTLPLREDA